MKFRNREDGRKESFFESHFYGEDIRGETSKHLIENLDRL